MRSSGLAALPVLGLVLAGACGSTLPEDVVGYETRCTRLNAQPIPRYDGDPHAGTKNVYACGVSLEDLRAHRRPFPDGTLIVKDSTREGQAFSWLVATARKQGGAWRWDEYTRNFGDEDFRHILAGQSVCTSCHVKAQAADWIFSAYGRGDGR
jgi:hypothetical protein